MIRKSIAFLLTLALLLCGTACGKQTAEKPTDSNADNNPPASVVTPDYTIEDYLAAIDRGDFETALTWLAQYADTDILTDERIVDFLDKIAILPVETYIDGEHILYSYDEKGHLTKKEVSYTTDGEERRRTYEYPHDAYGNLLSYFDSPYNVTLEYDSNGNLTKEIYTSNKYGSYEILYSYNDKNQLIRKESTENYLGYTDIYTYHANGHTESITTTFSRSGVHKQTFNEDGQLLTIHDSDGNYIIYTYDEDGRIIGQEYKNELYDEPRKATLFYDEEGRYLGSHSASLSGDLVREETYTYYTYNGKDYVLTYKRTDEYGTDERVYTYEKDRLMSETCLKDGETTSETVYTYNEDGRLKSTKHSSFSSFGDYSSESTFTYQDGKLVSVKSGDKTEYTYTYNENGDIATISVDDITYNGYGVCLSFINEESNIRCIYRVMYYPDGVPKCLTDVYGERLTIEPLVDLTLFRGVPEAPQAEMPIIPTDELPYGVIKFY